MEKILNGPFSRPASASFSGEPINYRGVPVIVTAKPLEGTDLALVLSYDVAEALQPVREFQKSLLGLGLFVAILVGAISVLFGRSLTSPILHLVEVVAEIRNGKLERRADVRSSDEISLLAHSFNEMTNELVNTNAILEEHVARRTADLDETNQALEARAVELRRYNAELEQFASIASHDLQEPLRKVHAFGDRMRSRYSDVLDERRNDYLRHMQESAERMQLLIADLLDFPPVNSCDQSFYPVDVADEVCTVPEVQIQAAHASIEIESLPTVDADVAQMRQLFQNLIGNSLKYSQADSPARIRIWTEETDARVIIHIQDNSIGFDEQYNERIFDIFQRLHGRDKFPGTGIGLAVRRKIVERLAFGPTPGAIIDGRLIRTPYFNWGWNYLVSSTSSFPEIVYLFTLFASSPAMSTASVREAGGYFDPFRGRHYEDKPIREAYSPEFLAAHEDSMRNSIPDLYRKCQVEYFDELRLNIKAADAGTKTPKQAIDDTVAAWNDITERMGKRSQLVQWLYLKSTYPTRLSRALV